MTGAVTFVEYICVCIWN